MIKTMVVLGDSTAEGGGWLSSKEERWPDILSSLLETAQESPIEYFNASIKSLVISPHSPGYNVQKKISLSERLSTEVLSRVPDLIILSTGLNDMRSGMRCNDFCLELSKILEQIGDSLDSFTVICGLHNFSGYNHYPPFNKGSFAEALLYNRSLRKIADEFNCLFADIWHPKDIESGVIHPDSIHPNKIGNILIANRIFEAIVHAYPPLLSKVRFRDEKSEWTTKVSKTMSS